MVTCKSGKREILTLKVAICDDYPEIANSLKLQLQDYCALHDLFMEFRIFHSGSEVLASDLSDISFIFLDIQMPEINGLETAREIRKRYPELIIIFVTDFIEYAPEGYHVAAFRYLLKSRLTAELPPIMDDVLQKISDSSEMVEVRLKEHPETIALKDVIYLEGTTNRFVKIHMTGNRILEVYGKLADFETELSGKGFLRLQRSFLANMAQISKISS